MSRYYTREKFLGLGLIVLSVLIGHYVSQWGRLETAPYYVVLVVIANLAGLRMAIFAAIMFSIGAYLQWFESHNTRFWLNFISFVMMAWIVGGLKRKARIIDTLNGNLDILWHIVREIDYLIVHWHTLSDKSKYLRVIELKNSAVDLTTNVLGWRKLAELKHDVDHNQEADTSTQEV